MKSNIYFGQKNDPFILDMNKKEIDKDKLNIIEKNKGYEQDYISSLSSKYKNEIIVLKNYIQRMNEYIRKQLDMETLPSLEEGFTSFSKKLKNGGQQNEIPRDVIHEWLNNLLNVDYINPLITLYEKYIKNLEEQLKNYQNINRKYENTINTIENENNDLRNQIQISEEQLKNFMEIRNESGDSSSLIVMDREHIMKLEERNQILSKENEILVVNYNNVLNELMQIKNENAYNGNEQNNNKYNQLNQYISQLKNEKEGLQNRNKINENKINEMAKKCGALESENDRLKIENLNLNKDLNTYRQGNKNYNILLDNHDNNENN
jgi:hypothetical protein